MALTTTLYTGLSGLDVNQTRLNVVGNNIANANTVAFKSSRVLYKPQFYVTDRPGAASDGDFGGNNPSQRGLGASVAAIQKNFASGAIDATGKATDLAIDGSGFFIVQGRDQAYTRDGSFSLNENNELVSTSGDYVQGYGVDSAGSVVAGTLEKIRVPLGEQTKAEASTKATFQGNLNANGPTATGASILNSQALTTAGGTVAPADTNLLTELEDASNGNAPVFAVGDKLTITPSRGGRDLAPLTYTVAAGSKVSDLQNFIQQASGVDLDAPAVTDANGNLYQAGTSLEAIAGDPPNSKRLALTGNVGADNALSLAGNRFSKDPTGQTIAFSDGQTASGASSNALGESTYTSVVTYDTLGNPITVNLTAVLEAKTNEGTTWRYFATSAQDVQGEKFDPAAADFPGATIGTGVLNFDTNGKFIPPLSTPRVSVDRENTGSGDPLPLDLDFTAMTSLTDTINKSSLTGSANGFRTGTLNSFSIGANGVVTGQYTNGSTSTIGQVAIARFDNESGLIDKGGNLFGTGANSGTPQITSPTQLGTGSIRAGALEQSNVDLSNEFINLIIASTGFSAASRVITTSDQLLQELLQTTR